MIEFVARLYHIPISIR